MSAKPNGSANGLLSRDEILNADDIREEIVPVPEWKGSVLVRSMSAGAYMDYAAFDRSDLVKGMLAMIAVSTHDANGARVFASVEDLEVLSKRNMAALERIFRVATRLNTPIIEAAASAKELEKNSEASRSGSSPTGSPSPLE